MDEQKEERPPEGSPAAVYAQAKALFEQKRFAEIVTLCEEAESRGAYNADVAAAHSVALIRLKRNDDAIGLLQHMLYYFPNDARLHFNLGSAYNAAMRRSEARTEYDIAKGLAPEIVRKGMRKMQWVRWSVFGASFVVFLLAFVFWPHTRWLVVGLAGALIILNVYIIIRFARLKQMERVYIYIGMLALWVLIMVLAIVR